MKVCAAGRGAESLTQSGEARRNASGSSDLPDGESLGDKSMSEKQGILEDAEGIALQDPRDRAKARLPESQSPAVETAHSLRQRLGCSAARGSPCDFCGLPPPTGRAMENDSIQGDAWDAYVALERSAPPERGMAYRTRVPWSRSPRSSLRWGKPATWRRGTGGRHFERRRVREPHLSYLDLWHTVPLRKGGITYGQCPVQRPAVPPH